MFWFLDNLYLCLFFVYLIVPPHELGHAVAAKLVGWKVKKIILGVGNHSRKINLLGFPWELYLCPGGGRVLPEMNPATLTPAKYAFFISGGLVANIVLAALIYPFLTNSPWGMQHLTNGLNPGSALFWANISAVLLVLRPGMNRSSHGDFPTDGMQLWKLLKNPTKRIAGLRRAIIMQRAHESYILGKLDEAEQYLEPAYQNYPDDKNVLSFRGVIALVLGDLEVASVCFAKYMDRKDLNANEQALAKNNLAYLYAILGTPDLLAKAELFSQQALETLPTEIFTRGTRASVLIAKGEYDAGSELLDKLATEVKEPVRVALNSCWRGLASFKLGKYDEARQDFAKAREAYPSCFLISRFESMLGLSTAPEIIKSK
jgi:hypothetical protein